MDSVIQIDPISLYDEVVTDIVNNLYVDNPTNKNISADVPSAKTELKKLISKNNYDIEAVVDYYESKNWDPQKKGFFISLIKENKTQLLLATLHEHNSTYGEVVTDFNWLLKLVFGTSELKANKYPVLQLILSLYSKTEQRNVVYDIDKTLLCKLIDVLTSVIENK